MDLSKLHWDAIHTNKTVRDPDYVDIERKTLQKIRLYKKSFMSSDEIVSFSRPNTDKWLISFRLRSQLVDGELSKRFWIFNDRTKKQIVRVHEDGKIDRVKDWKELSINPATITSIDEK